MSLLDPLSIRSKLNLSCGIMALVVAVTGAVALRQLDAMRAVAELQITAIAPAQAGLEQVLAHAARYRALQADQVLAGEDPGAGGAADRDIETLRALGAELPAALGHLARHAEPIGLPALQTAMRNFIKSTERVTAALRQGRPAEARALLRGEGYAAYQNLVAAAAAVETEVARLREVAATEAATERSWAALLIGIGVLGGVVLAALLAHVLHEDLGHGLTRLVASVRGGSLAEGGAGPGTAVLARADALGDLARVLRDGWSADGWDGTGRRSRLERMLAAHAATLRETPAHLVSLATRLSATAATLDEMQAAMPRNDAGPEADHAPLDEVGLPTVDPQPAAGPAGDARPGAQAA